MAFWIVLIAALGGARFLCANYWYFWEGDDISIATGVAALVEGNTLSDMYRYGPQVGYYRLVQGLTWLGGGEVTHIPVIMVTLSWISGTVIPLLGLGCFPDRLNKNQRVALTLCLFANPILWMSSEYGNTAIVSLAFIGGAITLLSRRGSLEELFALLLFVAGVLVRADGVLCGPVVALLLWYRHQALGPWLKRIAGLGVMLAVVYGTLLLVDERMGRVFQDVSSHLKSTIFHSHFFEYALWAISPIPLILALFGVRDMIRIRDRMLVVVIVWCLPLFLFYFATMTTPRYFLLSVIPISICAVLGGTELIKDLHRHLGKASIAVVFGAAAMHLLVPMDRIYPGHPREVVRNASVFTHDGHMWTGALIYHSVSPGGFLRRSVFNPGFGLDHAFPVSIESGLRDLADPTQTPRTIVLLYGPFPTSAFHFHAHAVGVQHVSRKPRDDSAPADASFTSETQWQQGNVSIVALNTESNSYQTMKRFPVEAGDEIWLAKAKVENIATVQSKLPPGMQINTIDGPGKPIVAYRVTKQIDHSNF